MYQGVVAEQIAEEVEVGAVPDEEQLVLWEEDQEEVEEEAEAMKLPNLNLEAWEVEEAKAEMQVYQKH